MDKKIQSQFATSGFQKYLIKNYLRGQLSGMIKVFRGRYPDYITVAQMNEELTMLDNLINKMKIEFNQPSTPDGTTTSHAGRITTNIRKEKSAPKLVTDVDRCHARVWDAMRLVWKLADGRQVYGGQCKKAKLPGGGCYCKKHTKKLTHEDWFKEPSDTMRRHFMRAVST